MIRSFCHKGLRRLYEDDDRLGVGAEHVERIAGILARLDAADDVQAMALPSYRLHALKGDLTGFWAVTVRANWRITFRLQHGDAWDVDLVDYH
ncbi:MAG TPA: type II toxin-antitoxin system RelE/ParE family toxin [Rhizobiaceae bacterium]|nr:type II toxin-antitoxin system RelE/ParE family toxin [Rhizobiaceae bacterium]